MNSSMTTVLAEEEATRYLPHARTTIGIASCCLFWIIYGAYMIREAREGGDEDQDETNGAVDGTYSMGKNSMGKSPSLMNNLLKPVATLRRRRGSESKN